MEYYKKHDVPCTEENAENLLYFVQVYFLMVRNRPCFKENMVASDKGIVVEKGIENNSEYNKITDVDKVVVNTVLDYFGKYEDYKIMNCIKAHEPWQEANKRKVKTINKKDIRSFYV